MTTLGASLLGRWTLDKKLGEGGMATVSAATHRNGNKVAIKVLHAEYSRDEAMRDRFLREGYVANAVDHPGAVRVQDDGVAEDGSAFLVMELLSGETFDSLQERHGGKVPPLEVLQLVDPLLDVLAAAHEKGIHHRDLKPENVFLTTTGQVKVLDFGIARMRDASGKSATATRTGTMMGTPAFMPPEQALGKVNLIDGQSDLWAVGATMFALLTGRFVHEAESVNEHLVLAATKPAPDIAQVDSTMPAVIARVVNRALAFEKADRFRDAKHMQDAVREAYGVVASGADITTSTLRGRSSEPLAAPKASTQPTAAPTVQSQRPSRAFPVVPVVAGGAIVVAIGLGLLATRSKTPDTASTTTSAATSAPAQAPAATDSLPVTVTPAMPVPIDALPAAPSASAAPKGDKKATSTERTATPETKPVVPPAVAPAKPAGGDIYDKRH